MIYTSYFGKVKKIPEYMVPVSIAASTPKWFVNSGGKAFHTLAPRFSLVMDYKNKEIDTSEYTEKYSKQLADLDPKEIVDELTDIFKFAHEGLPTGVSVASNPDASVVLLCYEKPEDFCHRKLVADWLTENGFLCEELRL